jgi:hypothetical protein
VLQCDTPDVWQQLLQRCTAEPDDLPTVKPPSLAKMLASLQESSAAQPCKAEREGAGIPEGLDAARLFAGFPVLQELLGAGLQPSDEPSDEP